MTFNVDTRLTDNALVIYESPDLLLTLVNDSRWPWLVVIPKAENATELYQLSRELRQRVNEFSAMLGREWMTLTDGHKLNVACIGNVVSQLHMHHVVRYSHDVAWPAPMWGFGEAVPYRDSQRDQLVSGIIVRLIAAGVSPTGFATHC